MALNAKRPRLVTFKAPSVVKANRLARAKAMRQMAGEMQKALRDRLGPNTPVVSQPYTSPNSKTGALKDSTTVKYEGGRLVVRTYQYGTWLEGGTTRMKPRPWIRRTMTQKRWGKRLEKLTKQYSK